MQPRVLIYVLVYAVLLLEQGSEGFFIKHVLTGMCVKDTAIIQSFGQWGSLSYVKLSDNCFDPAAQFRFQNTSAILNIKRQGCLAGLNRRNNGFNLNMFYVYVDAFYPHRLACTAVNAITPTSWGGLSTRVQTVPTLFCAVNASFPGLRSQDVDPYLNLTEDCSDAADKRFYFGAVTCFGQNITNTNCPSNKYMIIKTASYRGLREGSICGSTYDHICSADVTCYLKNRCDGQNECNVTVDDDIFPSNIFPDLNKYLYFEYQCQDSVTSFNETCHVTSGFFIKHLQSGKCIRNTGLAATPAHNGRSFYFLDLSDDCLDPAAQFTFLENNAIMKLNVAGCLRPSRIFGKGLGLHMLYIHFHENGTFDQKVCSTPVKQTSWGGLTMMYDQHGFQYRCLVNGTNQLLKDNQKVDPFLNVTDCEDGLNKRFNFGSVTCFGQKILNVSCPSNQLMVIQSASYRGLSDGNICGSSYEYSCHGDVTCDLKRHCDGRRECNVIVNDDLFRSKICADLNKYLYFEYQCVQNLKSITGIRCFHKVELSSSLWPNEGVLNINTMFNNFTICQDGSLKNVKNDVCTSFGFPKADTVDLLLPPESLDIQPNSAGSLSCDGMSTNLSRCSISPNDSCSSYAYLKCHICNRTLLDDRMTTIPNSSFSASVNNHNAKDARISSGSSWCARHADGNEYVQLTFDRLYVVNNIAIFGDGENLNRVTEYFLNSTTNLVEWTSILNENPGKAFQGIQNAMHIAAIKNFPLGIKTRGLRLIPTKSEGRPCLRMEICGGELHPGKVNLIITKVSARYVKISWEDPTTTGVSPGTSEPNPLTMFKILLWKKEVLYRNITVLPSISRPYTIDNILPYSPYSINISAENSEGFGEATRKSFSTPEDVPSGPPLNIRTSSRSTASLTFTWDPPAEEKQHGVIIKYGTCLSYTKNGACFENVNQMRRSWPVSALNPMTKYFLNVSAETNAGKGVSSESLGFYTNGEMSSNTPAAASASTLTFNIQTPPAAYQYIYIVAFKGTRLSSPDNYTLNNLMTYKQAKVSNFIAPYIAAVISRISVSSRFILGDGANTSEPTLKRRRSTARQFNNGRLEPSNSYIIFQRVILNNGDYYSTEWSSSSQTTTYEGLTVREETTSSNVSAKNNDLVSLLCSAEGEPPLTFTWTKDQKQMASYAESHRSFSSSVLALQVSNERSFGEYVCHIRDRFSYTNRSFWIVREGKTTTMVVVKDDEDDGKFIAVVVILVVLAIASFAAIFYLWYRYETIKSEKNTPRVANGPPLPDRPVGVPNNYDIPDIPTDEGHGYLTPTEMKETMNGGDHLYSTLNEFSKSDSKL